MSPHGKLEVRRARDAWLYARARRGDLEEQLRRIEVEIDEEMGTEHEWSPRRRHATTLERLERAAHVEWEAKQLLVRVLERVGALPTTHQTEDVEGCRESALVESSVTP